MQAFYNVRFRVPSFELQRVRSRELRASRLPEFQRTESRELQKAERGNRSGERNTEGEVRADAAGEVLRLGRRR